MRLFVLTFWVVGLIAVIHYCILGRVDPSSYLAGAIASGMVIAISWDGLDNGYAEDEDDDE